MYANFAYIYDRLMRDIPYDKWVNQIKKIVGKTDQKALKVLDMGCGTGNMSIPLAKIGFQVTALDLSADMLSVADQKASSEGLSIRFINQDMRELEIPGDFRLVLSMCDSLNYIVDEEDLKQVFSKVFNLLEQGGFFIFDLNSHYKISQIFGHETYILQEDDISYIWENSFDPDSNTCQMEISFFVQEENNLYRKFKEIHSERGYLETDIVKWLKETGFSEINTYGEQFEKPSQETERLFFTAKK